jgi:hypothetical protein
MLSALGVAWLGGMLHRPGSTVSHAAETDLLQRLRGYWTYELQNISTGDWILGAFQIDSFEGHLAIPSGHSYYAVRENGGFAERGVWRSKAVACDNNTIYVIFRMASTSNRPVAGDAHEYTGILELDITSSNTLAGTFHDLDVRHKNWGTVRIAKTAVDNMADAIVEAQRRHEKR